MSADAEDDLRNCTLNMDLTKIPKPLQVFPETYEVQLTYQQTSELGTDPSSVRNRSGPHVGQLIATDNAACELTTPTQVITGQNQLRNGPGRCAYKIAGRRPMLQYWMPIVALYGYHSQFLHQFHVFMDPRSYCILIGNSHSFGPIATKEARSMLMFSWD